MLSDSYIRPYAICHTPLELTSWLEETGIPPVEKSRKTGHELFHCGDNPLGISLLDFWQGSGSDYVNNATRGILAEFLVTSALGLAYGIRSEWDAFDLLLPPGHKIEVKSASYIQSWYQRELSRISFSVRETRVWDPLTNRQADAKKRQADIYVFCLLKHKIQATLDPLNVEQWDFYAVTTAKIDETFGHKKQIGLARLKKIASPPVSYLRLKEKILEMLG